MPHPSLHDLGLRQRGRRHLMRVDPVLTLVVRRCGDSWRGPRGRSYFAHLCRIIVGQQVSVKAAATMHRRLAQRLQRRWTPAALLELGDQDFRAAGISRQKISYLRDLARHFQRGSLRPGGLGRLDDEALVERLVAVRGLGRWSAEMFLIFALGRPDVLSTGDLGLQTAAAKLYHLEKRPSPQQFVDLAEPWRPYRSLASWYLWRSLANEPA